MEKELIEITINEEGQKLVSARELYEGLKFDDMDNFSRWIKKQLDNVDAVENIDFTKTLFKEGLSKTGQTKTDYILTIDIAKEICMVVGVAPRTNEETRKLSKQFRKFFIEAEKELRIIKKLDSYMIEDPIERAKRWIEEAEERKALMEENIKKDEEIKVLKPKAEFTDKFLQDDTLYKANSNISYNEAYKIGMKYIDTLFDITYINCNGYMLSEEGLNIIQLTIRLNELEKNNNIEEGYLNIFNCKNGRLLKACAMI